MKDMKACFFDIDGTLVKSDHTISEAVVDAVQRLEQEGVSPVIATGRSYEALIPIKERLGIQSPVICYNGGMIVNGKDDSIMTHHIIPEKASREIIEKARKLDFHLLAYRKGKLIYEKDRAETLEYSNRIKIDGEIVNYDKIENLELTKFIMLADHNKLELVRKELLRESGKSINAFFSDPRFLEIVPFGIDKGKAVEEVIKLLGITGDQTMAMGDGFNDLPMLQSVNWGIVMSNALPELRKMFPPERTAPHCDQDGVATYLKEFFNWV